MTLATVARTPDNPTKMPCSKKPIVPPTGRRLNSLNPVMAVVSSTLSAVELSDVKALSNAFDDSPC